QNLFGFDVGRNRPKNLANQSFECVICPIIRKIRRLKSIRTDQPHKLNKKDIYKMIHNMNKKALTTVSYMGIALLALSACSNPAEQVQPRPMHMEDPVTVTTVTEIILNGNVQ